MPIIKFAEGYCMYQGDYTLIGSELSFFSRKLEAQLRFQQIPWHWEFKTLERTEALEARAGTHFIPLLRTPDKWLIHDTIAIGPMLDERFTSRPVIPPTPLQRTCCFVLEDAFNHWLARTCVHTRWCYPENVAWAGPRFGANMVLDRSIEIPFSDAELEELTPIGTMMYEGFGKNACEYTGVGPEQAAAVKADFERLLAALAEHFQENDFILGPRPCVADFALAGASKAHFITDPLPLSWLGKHQQMLTDYTEKFFSGEMVTAASWLDDDAVPATLSVLLDYLQHSYFHYVDANASALGKGEKYFEYDYGFGPTRARSLKRLNMARRHVQNELLRCADSQHAASHTLFSGRGILEYYLDEANE